MQATDMSCDESSFTGENEPVYKSAELPAHVMDRKAPNDSIGVADAEKRALITVAFMGTLVRTGKAKVSHYKADNVEATNS